MKGNSLRERFMKKNRHYTLLYNHKEGGQDIWEVYTKLPKWLNAKQNCQNNWNRSLLNTLKIYAVLHVWNILTKAEKITQSFSFKIKTE